MMSIDLEEEDLTVLNSPQSISTKMKNVELAMSHKLPVVISYAHLDLSKTDYHFRQEFTLKDTQAYFSMMKEISNSTIDDWLENPHEHHFYRTDVRGRLAKALEKLCPGCLEANPLIYHFALYTDAKGADRAKGRRSPRIYFMLGQYGRIYILFFDPFHEVNP